MSERIVLLAPRYPLPCTRGDQRRVLHLVTGLSRHAEVTLLCFGPAAQPLDPGVRAVTVTHRLWPALAANATARDPRLPLQVRLHLDAQMRRAVRAELARPPRPVLHATLARMAPYLSLDGARHRHLDLIDALSVNMEARGRATFPPAGWGFAAEARLLRRYEREMAAAADTCSLVSEEDRRRRPELAHAAIVPNGVDPESFPYRDPAARPPVLLFFGNLGYFPNEQAAAFVAREVLPRVRTSVPAVSLRVVGHRPSLAVRRLGRLPGVTVVGPVERLDRELHAAALAVVPMLSGTGMKNKVLEAFCAGTPVVTNAMGIAGVTGAQSGCHFLAAEGPSALAEACGALLLDGERRVALGRAARRLVEQRYTWARQVEALLALYRG
jgi:glycosyltransferase involved in cell wall biosynthesis